MHKWLHIIIATYVRYTLEYITYILICTLHTEFLKGNVKNARNLIVIYKCLLNLSVHFEYLYYCSLDFLSTVSKNKRRQRK